MMDREKIDEIVLEELAASEDADAAAYGRKRLDEREADEESVRNARERRGY